MILNPVILSDQRINLRMSRNADQIKLNRTKFLVLFNKLLFYTLGVNDLYLFYMCGKGGFVFVRTNFDTVCGLATFLIFFA